MKSFEKCAYYIEVCVSVCVGVANLFLAANKVLGLITDGGRGVGSETEVQTRSADAIAHVCGLNVSILAGP